MKPAHKDQIVLAVGHDTREWLVQRALLAEHFGTPVVDFPGDHKRYGVHPAAFAAKPREILI